MIRSDDKFIEKILICADGENELWFETMKLHKVTMLEAGKE